MHATVTLLKVTVTYHLCLVMALRESNINDILLDSLLWKKRFVPILNIGLVKFQRVPVTLKTRSRSNGW
jgi:hypothetical protein